MRFRCLCWSVELWRFHWCVVLQSPACRPPWRLDRGAETCGATADPWRHTHHRDTPPVDVYFVMAGLLARRSAPLSGLPDALGHQWHKVKAARCLQLRGQRRPCPKAHRLPFSLPTPRGIGRTITPTVGIHRTHEVNILFQQKAETNFWIIRKAALDMALRRACDLLENGKNPFIIALSYVETQEPAGRA